MNVGTSNAYRDTERSQAMQILMVFNPKAGQRRLGRLRRTVARLKREGIEVKLQATTARGDAERFAHEAGSGLNGFASLDLLAIAGGDGTINEAVNGLIRPPAGQGASSARDRAAGHGQCAGEGDRPGDLLGRRGGNDRSAARRVQVYLGPANGRCFTIMAGAGFDAHVVANVSLRLKRASARWPMSWRPCASSSAFPSRATA